MGTNLLSGLSQDAESATLGGLSFSDPTACHTWMNDFDDYDASQWVITETGSGTRAVSNANNGILLITNAGSDNDANFLQWSGVTGSGVAETFLWDATKSMWFKARLKVSDATQTDFVIGLQITDTTPLAVSDGLYFQKDDDTTTLYFKATKDSTSTTVTPVGTIVSDTYFTCGFWWDAASGQMLVYFNDERVGTITSVTNFPGDEELTISFGVQNGDANARSLSLDYVFASSER